MRKRKRKVTYFREEEKKGLFLEQKNVFLLFVLTCILEEDASQEISDPCFELSCHFSYTYMEAEMNVDLVRPGRKL